MSRTVTTYGLGVKFTADEQSLQRIAMGGTIKLASFTDAKFGTAGNRVIPAGTVVIRDTDKSLIPAAGTEAAGKAFLMASDIVEAPVPGTSRGSDLTTGLYAGGVIYEDQLPDATGTPKVLSAGLKTALGSNFIFQASQGSLIVTV
ncbi:hypothetical protein EHF33_03120 [Deinococcus psychrotolerans]|uniref:Uncharacterized protein n=1 Tax=Deinococcus psychrotolerans TaxID=2489213 RepID=A0A3G8YLA0_9DEIO|nr:hypothetical protein [Deinococcus psychrotolerans]AZI41866.1 hypothetical protein EHF33_03120 [Deinococcus psychrotolerans]